MAAAAGIPGAGTNRTAGAVSRRISARPSRRTRRAALGPCLAGGEDGLLLLSDAWRRFSGQAVLLDIPLANTPALAGAEAMGLTPQRRLLRMRRGGMLTPHPPGILGHSRPEKG